MTAADERPRPSWFESRLPEAAECSLRLLLEKAAADRPDKLFAIFEHGERWTYREALEQVRRTAAGLHELGVQPGDVVLNWLPNGSAFLRTWFGALYLGALHAPIHTAFKGDILEHLIGKSGARALIAGHELVGRLTELDLGALEVVVSVGGPGARLEGVRVAGDDVLDRPAEILELGPPRQPWDIAQIIYTSGTTGHSKGVLVPYAQLWTVSVAFFGFMTRADRMMVVTPLCHIGPISGVYAALVTGASVIVLSGFQSKTFWDDARSLGATCVPGLSSAILKFVMSTLPDGDDDIGLRATYVSAVEPTAQELAARVGLEYFAAFSMTETSLILIADPNSDVLGSCGKVRDGVTVRLVDEHDIEVGPGETGELVVRPDLPWTMNAGYHNDPEATAHAWRNGWFHTGDQFRCDSEGNYYFVGRAKDVIRRRGENISAREVEAEALRLAGVRDVAALGVPSDDGDEEVLLVLTSLPGATLSPLALAEALADALPHFMVPRYFHVMDELPKTASNRVRKTQLREMIELGHCWDRTTELVLRRDWLRPSHIGTPSTISTRH